MLKIVVFNCPNRLGEFQNIKSFPFEKHTKFVLKLISNGLSLNTTITFQQIAFVVWSGGLDYIQ